MKIDNSLKPVITGASTGKTAAPKAEADPRIQQTDSVQISALSTQIKAMETGMASTPVVNLDRVNQIKQAISEGRFKINPDAISNKLISTVKDLIQSNGSNA
ncbi:MAG: flagellar biosynthesis anti-sigma factor FlgM [Burkholderiales bacterium]|nr:flagellar biosynthesis anti-sigma factor FlgM [Burkholderiales bacterium]